MSSASRPDPTADATRGLTASEATSTRARVVTAAMDLFGRQGYKATTIAQVEAAAGLSPGAGGLYRHFATKRALLEAGMQQQFDQGAQLLSFLADPAQAAAGDLRDRLLAVARAGLRRLEQERDVNRLLLRDLADFPDLLEAFRRQELQRVYGTLTGWLRREAAGGGALDAEPSDVEAFDVEAFDVEALAAVLVSAVSHYWVLTDVFGTHPLGVDEDRYLGAVAELAAQALRPPG